MIIHIGLPRAASTSIKTFMTQRLRVADAGLHELRAGVDADYVRAESVADSVYFTGDPQLWRKCLYCPGGWEAVCRDLLISPHRCAEMLKQRYPDAKILLVTRNKDDWLQSVYRYCLGRLPPGKRAFADWLRTPSGITHMRIDQHELARAYGSRFETLVLKYEFLLADPREFMRSIARLAGVKPGRLPHRNRGYPKAFSALRAAIKDLVMP